MKSSRCTGSSSKPQQHRAQRCFSFQVLSAQEMFSKRGLCVWREFLQLHPDPAVCRVPPCKQKIQPEIILLNIFFLYHSGVKREGIKTRTALKTPVRHAEYHKLRLSDCIYLTEQEDDFYFFLPLPVFNRRCGLTAQHPVRSRWHRTRLSHVLCQHECEENTDCKTVN